MVCVWIGASRAQSSGIEGSISRWVRHTNGTRERLWRRQQREGEQRERYLETQVAAQRMWRWRIEERLLMFKKERGRPKTERKRKRKRKWIYSSSLFRPPSLALFNPSPSAQPPTSSEKHDYAQPRLDYPLSHVNASILLLPFRYRHTHSHSVYKHLQYIRNHCKPSPLSTRRYPTTASTRQGLVPLLLCRLVPLPGHDVWALRPQPGRAETSRYHPDLAIPGPGHC